MLSYRLFFLFLALVAGVLGFIGAAGIFEFIAQFVAVVFLTIVILATFWKMR
jgi:uncharacterized membrane protein YtjA (UPF0391 family)